MILTKPGPQPLRQWAPWTDRRGRLHPLRAVVFTLLLLPAAWLLLRGTLGMLGARPLNAAIHSTGYWAAWIFLVSLLVTPAKALLGMPNIAVVRRMIGLGAMSYALLHLLLYVADQNWRLLAAATEIVLRVYLLIGFVALLGLVVLGVTSTDAWVKRLGRSWKRLHRLAYALMVLVLVHFFLQSKADVSQATLAAGVFAWAMIWRILPAGRDRGPAPLLGLALAAGVAALAVEYAWYRFGTHIDPARVARGELQVEYGLHPAGLVLLVGTLAAGALELRNLAQTRFGASAAYAMLVYALGALVGEGVSLALGWPIEDVVPDGVPAPLLLAATLLLFALLGMARHWLRNTGQRYLLDALWAAAVLVPVLAMGLDNPQAGAAGAAATLAGAVLLTWRVWPVSRGAALLVLPLAALAGFEAVRLFGSGGA